MGEGEQLTRTLIPRGRCNLRYLLPATSAPPAQVTGVELNVATSEMTQVSTYKCNYVNWKGNHVLAVLHTLSHKERGKERNDKAGWKSNGRKPGNECDRITLARTWGRDVGVDVHINVHSRASGGGGVEGRGGRRYGRDTWDRWEKFCTGRNRESDCGRENEQTRGRSPRESETWSQRKRRKG